MQSIKDQERNKRPNRKQMLSWVSSFPSILGISASIISEANSCIYIHTHIHFICFFKQKTAYEFMPSLVGSEMCIRDRSRGRGSARPGRRALGPGAGRNTASCLLYTSDAADDLLCVDLGGRRIIKKK